MKTISPFSRDCEGCLKCLHVANSQLKPSVVRVCGKKANLEEIADGNFISMLTNEMSPKKEGPVP
jgi:hypothetical protein